MFNTASLARNIRKARLYRNYSQDYLAFKLGMSQNGYSRIELGQTKLSVEKLAIIAQTLEVDIAKLIKEPEISDDVSTISTMPLGPQLLEMICRTTGMGFAAIARVTDTQWMACSVLDKISFGLKSGDELQLETTLCNEIRQHQQAVVIDHVSEDSKYAGHPTPERYGFQSYISMPIFRQDGSFFGTLCAIDPKPAKLDNPHTISLFKIFAQLVSYYLDATERAAFTRECLPQELLNEQFREILNSVSLPVVNS
jgi:transcriptional regulator with XRE-family HTH domain